MVTQTNRVAVENASDAKHSYAWAIAVVILCIGIGGGLLSSMLWMGTSPFAAGAMSVLGGAFIVAGAAFAFAVLTPSGRGWLQALLHAE